MKKRKCIQVIGLYRFCSKFLIIEKSILKSNEENSSKSKSNLVTMTRIKFLEKTNCKDKFLKDVFSNDTLL